MGIFGSFSKENKKSLDEGLEKTKSNFFSKLGKAVAGKSKVDDEILDDLEEVVISSDIQVQTTINIIERNENRIARDK
jgi:fused signal recognition particle receptor